MGPEARRSYDEKIASGFWTRFAAGPNILDIGFRGDDLDALPIAENAIGVDLDYRGYDGRTLPFGTETQDTVYSSHCLEHIPDYIKTIQEWWRVLRFDGYIITVVPHAHLYERRLRPPSRHNRDHRRFYTPASLLVEFEEALEPNSYRVRHLADNDKDYDYERGTNEHPRGAYEIELVVQKIKPPTWKLDFDCLESYLEISHLLAKHGQFQEAEAELRRAIEIEPQPLAFGHLGRVLLRLGRLEEAEAAVRRAIDLGSSHASLYDALSSVLARQDKISEAITAARQALSIEPANSALVSHLGALLTQAGDFEAAETMLRDAIATDPNNPHLFGGLANVLVRKGDIGGGEAALRRATELSPPLAHANAQYGDLLARQDRLDEAVAAMRKAIEIEPWHGPFYDRLSHFLARQGKIGEAITAVRRALEIEPQNSMFEQRLHKLAAEAAPERNAVLRSRLR